MNLPIVMESDSVFKRGCWKIVSSAAAFRLLQKLHLILSLADGLLEYSAAIGATGCSYVIALLIKKCNEDRKEVKHESDCLRNESGIVM